MTDVVRGIIVSLPRLLFRMPPLDSLLTMKKRCIHLILFASILSSVLSQTTEEPHPDIVVVFPVEGEPNPGGLGWADSYSVGDRCYCTMSTFDHGIGDFPVNTPLGWKSVREVCALLGDGPGHEGRPLYNDVQCGNGPPNNAGDEHTCPGRVDIGSEGCGHIGPTWNFEDFVDAPVPSSDCREVTYRMPVAEMDRFDRRQELRERQRLSQSA